ncbi:unnamed protein product [Durusdinium trenchii]|uniref:Uncharacterized protein n=2 Tax=Durusdinium trenchii TaxID=1381693 RepID=A0ABP0IQF2_9DINO
MFLLTVAALVLELPPVLGSPQCQNRSLENRSTKPGVDRPCLCAFDVDRTLTGYQELREECPLNLVKDGVKDYAYLYATPRGFGFLTLSELSQGLNATFCRHCYLGIASAGGAGLDDEKAVLSSVLHAGVARGELYEALPNWTTGENPEEQVESEAPFVVWCAEGQKNLCVKKIVEWYRSERNVSISDEDVYFFDDKEDNISPFVQTNYNAFQVSCGSRNGSRGLCGGRVAEVWDTKGVFLCEGEQQVCMEDLHTTTASPIAMSHAWGSSASAAWAAVLVLVVSWNR